METGLTIRVPALSSSKARLSASPPKSGRTSPAPDPVPTLGTPTLRGKSNFPNHDKAIGVHPHTPAAGRGGTLCPCS